MSFPVPSVDRIARTWRKRHKACDWDDFHQNLLEASHCWVDKCASPIKILEQKDRRRDIEFVGGIDLPRLTFLQVS